jgi:hypothetical protein
MPPKVWLTSNPSIVVIDWHPQEILRCKRVYRSYSFRQTVKINPCRFLSPLGCSPSLPNSFSLSVSLSLLLALLPVMIDLYSFHIKTSWSACLIIIDCNKLSEDTPLFHLGDCLQYTDPRHICLVVKKDLPVLMADPAVSLSTEVTTSTAAGALRGCWGLEPWPGKA